MAAPAPIDPTKAGKYPVILSDALLGKISKGSSKATSGTYTGVRYNHKPALAPDAAPSSSRLKKSAREGFFNLGFDDRGGRYQYNGVRTSEDGNYVLIFDPARKAFVLHQLDSMFHMNLTKTPTDGAEALRKKFPALEVRNAGRPDKQPPPKGKNAPAPTEKAKPAPANTQGKGKGKEKAAPVAPAAKGKAKQEKAAPKQVELTMPSLAPAPPTPKTLPMPKKAPSVAMPKKAPALPMPKKAAPPPPPPPAEEKKPRRRAPTPESDEDDDDNGGLILEFPDGDPSSSSSFAPLNAFSPALPTIRRFSEFVKEEGEYGDEIYGEDGDEVKDLFDEEVKEAFGEQVKEQEEEEEEEEEDIEMEDVALPSTVNQPAVAEPERFEFEAPASAEDEDPDLADLEAELYKAFDELSQEEVESDMSEEE